MNARCCLLFQLFPVQLVLIPQIGSAQFVDLTAQIEIMRWNDNGVSQEKPWIVHCVVGTNSWQMDGQFLRGATGTAWFTGTNIVVNYELTKSALPDQAFISRRERAEGFVQTATTSGQRWTQWHGSFDGNPGRPIRQGDLLPTLNSEIAWLAFCSSFSLKREGRKLYPPSVLWKCTICAPEGFSDKTVLFEDQLNLPKSIRLFTTNSVALQYGVSRSTNYWGWEFPLEFQLVQYRPVLAAETNTGWQVDFIAKGTLISIGDGKQPRIPAEVAESFSQ